MSDILKGASYKYSTVFLIKNYEKACGYATCRAWLFMSFTDINSKYSAYNVNVWPQSSYSSIQDCKSILMLCEQAKMGEDGVLAEYLP